MVLGFKDRFEPMVEDGSKTHSIRAGDRWRVGMTCHCYVKVRQKGMRLIGAWECVKVEVITIAQVRNSPRGPVEVEIAINGMRLDADELNTLAWRDGFRSRGKGGAFGEMTEFWLKTHGKKKRPLKFKGQVIHWKYTEAGLLRNLPEKKGRAKRKTRRVAA